MSKLQKALYELNLMEQASQRLSPLHAIDPRAKLLVTVLFLGFMLSLPLLRLPSLLLFFVYPMVSCSMAGISYSSLFGRSLFVLPFVALIGIFNPFLDRRVVFYAGDVAVSAGWISFVSILLRGLLSVQAVFVLILSTGFYNLCRGMQRMGVPALFATQLLFVHRYIFVLLQEALCMSRARDARSFGKKSYPFRLWGTFVGQLLLRTVDRAERIHRAMLSRGFSGSIPGRFHGCWGWKETIYLLVWTLLFLLNAFIL